MEAVPSLHLEWSPDELGRAIAADAPLCVLDVRRRNEFAAWHIVGRNRLSVVNAPYAEMVERTQAIDDRTGARAPGAQNGSSFRPSSPARREAVSGRAAAAPT